MIMTNSLSDGFSGLMMPQLPQEIQEMLKNTQVITNPKTVATIRSQVSELYLSYFDDAYMQAKTVLANSIHDVFLFCVVIAAIGFVCALFLREAPTTRSLKMIKGETVKTVAIMDELPNR